MFAETRFLHNIWVAFNIYSVYRDIYITRSLPYRKSAIRSVFYVFPDHCSITAAGHCFSYFQSLVMSLFRPVTYKSVSGSYMNLQITWWISHVWGLKSSEMWCSVFRNQSHIDSVTFKKMWTLNNTTGRTSYHGRNL